MNLHITKRILLFLFCLNASLSFAQCPTVPTSNVTICDASGFTFADLNAFATDNGDGIVWYSSLTETTPFASVQLVTEGTYYVSDMSNTCSPRPEITVTFDVSNSGQILDGIFCSNENATIQTYIDDVLTPNVPSGGNVIVYTDFELTTIANTSLLLIGNANYFIVFIDALGCESQIEFGSIAVFPSPETPTPPNPQQFCSNTNPTIGSLNPGTTNSFSWYEAIDGIGNPIPPALNSATPLVDGNMYYVQGETFFCKSDTASVIVSIDDPVNAGNSGTLNYCEDNVRTDNFDLFNELTGAPETTGLWTGPLPTSPDHLGTVNITGLTANSYTFTYTVLGINACPDATATVTITIHPELNVGTVNGSASFCESGSPSDFDLSILLNNEDVGGQWTQGTLSTDPVVSSPIDLSNLAPGLYDFTYTQNLAPNPCLEDSETVQVEILEDPNPGVAMNPEFCENDLTPTPFNLFDALDGTQDNNLGIWTDASNNTTTNLIDISTFTAISSPYIYTYTISNGSCEDSENIIITVLPAPESGIGNNFNTCLINIATTPTLNLFDQLTGNNLGGTWSDDNNSLALTGSAVNLSMLSTNTIFNFTYTVLGTGTCLNDTETISVIINETIAPTVMDNTQDFCDSATIADLQVSGNNIQWYEDNISLTPLDSSTQLVDGNTYYASQIDAVSNCESLTRTEITATIFLSPNSGVAINNTICNTEVNFNLFSALDGSQDNTGTWLDAGGTGALSGSILDASMIAPGDYNFTYTVVANPPCVNASTTVTITVNTPVTAGTNNVLMVCSTDTAIDLFPILGGATTGGDWTLNGTPVTNIINPSTAGSGAYIYTIANSCNNETALIQVTITQAANAGLNNTIALCLSDGSINLLNELNGTPDITGSWSPPLNSGTHIFNPELDSSGTYVYTVNSTSPCTVNAMASVTVMVNNTATPVTTISNANLCVVDSPTIADLNSFTSGNNIQWYEDNISLTPLDSSTPLVNGEDYYATQTDPISSCVSSVRAQINVNLSGAPTPTLVNDGGLFCINDNPTIENLTTHIIEVNTTLNNVIWYDNLTNGVVYSNVDLLINGQTYYAALINPTTNCESSIRLPVPVDLSVCDTLEIPDGFSPNGDGTNDTFTINNIEFIYPNYEIEFYNRYGDLVYKTNAKSEEFKGVSNQPRILNKSELPVGVYYYILNYNDGVTEAKQGRLYLNR